MLQHGVVSENPVSILLSVCKMSSPNVHNSLNCSHLLSFSHCVSGGEGGVVPGTRVPSSRSKFFHFHAVFGFWQKFCRIIGFCPQFRGWWTQFGESCIRHCQCKRAFKQTSHRWRCRCDRPPPAVWPRCTPRGGRHCPRKSRLVYCPSNPARPVYPTCGWYTSPSPLSRHHRHRGRSCLQKYPSTITDIPIKFYSTNRQLLHTFVASYLRRITKDDTQLEEICVVFRKTIEYFLHKICSCQNVM